MNTSFWALIAASGSGSRLAGDAAKQFLPILDKPMLAYSIEAFLASSAINGVMLVCNDKPAVAPLVQSFSSRRLHVSSGADRRSQSVYQGLCAIESLDDNNPVVLVHDAARPCLHRDDLLHCLQHLQSQPNQALALATQATDSVKQSAGGLVDKSLERNSIWLAQTPQCARLHPLKDALEKQEEFDSSIATDDAWFLERAGHSVHLLPAKHANIKVTWQEDMAIAAAILAAREE